MVFAQEHVPNQLNRFPSCAINRLRLRNFRNYTQLSIDLEASIVIVNGPNGTGKTNLLEAISFLSPGRGLRRARLRDVQNANALDEPSSRWAIAAKVYGPIGYNKISSRLGKTKKGTDCRLVRNNGVSAQPTDLAQLFGVQWLTPTLDRIFMEGRSSRRKFLDRLVLGQHPDHGRRVRAYERNLQERTKLQQDRNVDPTWLSAVEARIAANGVAVAAARKDTLSSLKQLLADAPGQFPRPELAVGGQIETWLEELPEIDVEERFAAILKKNRRRDFETKGTTVGPHRSDLIVYHAKNQQPASQCSTGEQKALLISIILANSRAEAQRRGAAPILLLDEVTAHLDQQRRDALFEEIQSLGGQAWLSGTDRNLFAPLTKRAQFISVISGHATLER